MKATAVFIALFAFSCAAGLQARPIPTAGARALSLGNAYTAENEDVNVLFFNPAGLTGLSGRQVALNYGRLDPGGRVATTEGHAAYGMPYQFRGRPIGAAGGFLAQSIASGAHVFDIYSGFGMDVPTRGLVPWPVRGGGVFKIRQQQGNDITSDVGKTKIGFGLDAGALVEFRPNLTGGVVLRDLYPSGLNPAGPQLRLGGRYRRSGSLQFLADVEIRKGVTALHAGAEWSLYRDLLRLRAGNGFSAGPVDHVALGAGFHFSPAQFDVAYVIPVRTFNDTSGQFRLSFLYRFNAPKFSEIYFDRALDQAEALDRKVTQLEDREAQLKSSLQDLEQARRLAEEELARVSVRRSEGTRGLDQEIVKAQARLAELEKRVKETEGRVQAAEETIRRADRIRASQAPRPDAKPAVKTHVVQPGDSLRSLAERYYKDPERWEAIYNANKDKVDRGRPTPGAVLVIPE